MYSLTDDFVIFAVRLRRQEDAYPLPFVRAAYHGFSGGRHVDAKFAAWRALNRNAVDFFNAAARDKKASHGS